MMLKKSIRRIEADSWVNLKISNGFWIKLLTIIKTDQAGAIFWLINDLDIEEIAIVEGNKK